MNKDLNDNFSKAKFGITDQSLTDLTFYCSQVAAAAAPRLNLLGNGVFRGVMTCRDDGFDGSVGGLGGGVPTVNPT